MSLSYKIDFVLYNSGYDHITSNHSIGQFGLTTMIESIWGDLKSSIRKMHTIIPAKNCIYFQREAEYR